MTTDNELQFLGRVRDFAKTGTWAQMREMLMMLQAQHIRAGASLPDPMAGRCAARADELGKVIEFVDRAGDREREASDALKVASEEEAQQQNLGEGGGEYTTPVATV